MRLRCRRSYEHVCENFSIELTSPVVNELWAADGTKGFFRFAVKMQNNAHDTRTYDSLDPSFFHLCNISKCLIFTEVRGKSDCVKYVTAKWLFREYKRWTRYSEHTRTYATCYVILISGRYNVLRTIEIERTR